MDLFTPLFPTEKLHPNFIQTTHPALAGERAVVQQWAEGFKDRDGKLIQEFQTTFNSTFWELYLHGVFRAHEFEIDWSHAAPDFAIRSKTADVIIEATTANAAAGATPEWEKNSSVSEPVRQHDFTELNKVAISRLSNALLGKLRKYRESYKLLDHVKGKPFVIAVAPFEQPSFQHQYDRPMRALLYDDYVDETAFYKRPQDYPNGPPSISLGHVEKPNGATIDLGIFNSDEWSEVSAVMFSCVATWGKTVALSNVAAHGWVFSSWGTEPNGKPALRRFPVGQPSENITDGLQVFHNPHARYPVSLEFFRREGVVQHYITSAGPVRENYGNCLQTRSSISLRPTAPIAAPERQGL